MNENDFQDALQTLLNAAGYVDGESDAGDLEAEAEPFQGCHVTSYEEAGVLTRNSGLVVRTTDGSEFQLTIVQSQYAGDDDENDDEDDDEDDAEDTEEEDGDETVDREDRCENCGNRSKDELIWIENGVDGEVECGRCGHHYRITHA